MKYAFSIIMSIQRFSKPLTKINVKNNVVLKYGGQSVYVCKLWNVDNILKQLQLGFELQKLKWKLT